mmetsp:Transcript_86723/g.250273  ORF Transcript_86723/g.250273 Transcript_86723/m.250273 type:complete len:245 (-) Transcript_86723:225-959(-)
MVRQARLAGGRCRACSCRGLRHRRLQLHLPLRHGQRFAARPALPPPAAAVCVEGEDLAAGRVCGAGSVSAVADGPIDGRGLDVADVWHEGAGPRRRRDRRSHRQHVGLGGDASRVPGRAPDLRPRRGHRRARPVARPGWPRLHQGDAGDAGEGGGVGERRAGVVHRRGLRGLVGRDESLPFAGQPRGAVAAVLRPCTGDPPPAASLVRGSALRGQQLGIRRRGRLHRGGESPRLRRRQRLVGGR